MKNNFLPTQPENRIELLDVLRGFAIAGVLLSNILIFSGYVFTPFSELRNMHLAELNSTIEMIINLIVKGRFYPILMILFGAGLYMQFKKSDKEGFLKFFIRRMLLLVLIGIVHTTFWAGDVVTVYALFAFLLIPVRRLKIRGYLLISVVLFVIHIISAYMLTNYYSSVVSEGTERIAQFQYSGIEPNDLINNVRNNGVGGLKFITTTQLEFLWSIPRYARVTPTTLLLFILGGYLFGSGFFTEKAHKLKYMIPFFVIGLIGTYFMYYVSWIYFSFIGNTFMALAYISLVAFAINKVKAQRLIKSMIPIGRMALTNYIMQSIICVLIFYGVGLAYFAKLPLYMVYIISIVILIFQIQFSKFWLRKYKFGPVEWIWRRLSYGKR